LTLRTRIVLSLGTAQTLAWGSTYYLPAVLAEPIARDLGVTTGNVFGAFSLALIVTALLGPISVHRLARCACLRRARASSISDQETTT